MRQNNKDLVKKHMAEYMPQPIDVNDHTPLYMVSGIGKQ